MPNAAREDRWSYWASLVSSVWKKKFFFSCGLEGEYANYGGVEDISVPLVSIGSDSTPREMSLSVHKIQ